MRALKAFIPAVLVAYVLGSLISTLTTMNTLLGFDMPVTPVDTLQAVWFDLLGMVGSYLPMIAVALLIAFPVAARLAAWFGVSRPLLYALAGFVALIALHLIMEMMLGLVGFASVRTLLGLLLQGCAGGVSGWLFAQWCSPRQAS